jgi:hypothetical protein
MKTMKLQYKISILVFSACLLMSGQALAQTSLVVDFENTPLFSEANFTPGDSASRWIKVTNNSGEKQDIIIEAININDSNDFAQSMNIQILHGVNILFDNSLKEFLTAGEISLGELENSNTSQYDLLITFSPESGNDYQELNLGFDILIGFDGTDNQETDAGGGGGGGGGSVLPGLSILSESVRVVDVQETSVTINWNTSYLSTSQVVYGRENELHSLDLNAVNFGYANAYPDPEDFNKVTGHSVTILGLDPGETYYFRCISHASPPTISKEYTFSTQVEEVIIPIVEGERQEDLIIETDNGVLPLISVPSADSLETADTPIIEDLEPAEDVIEDIVLNNNGSFAAIGNIINPKFLNYLLILILFIIIILSIRWIVILYIRRRRKNN